MLLVSSYLCTPPVMEALSRGHCILERQAPRSVSNPAAACALGPRDLEVDKTWVCTALLIHGAEAKVKGSEVH